MSIQLATPFHPGDIDPGVIYDHVELSNFAGDFIGRVISFCFQRGTLDAAGVFIPGKIAPLRFTVEDIPARGAMPERLEYSKMMAELTLDGELASSSVARIIYTYVLKNGIFVGTPVEPNA